jgi:hypothetical protein
VRLIGTRAGWFNGADDSESAVLHAEATAENEVLIEIQSDADWKGHGDDRPGANAHLNPIDALELSDQLRQAAVDALGSSVTEDLP